MTRVPGSSVPTPISWPCQVPCRVAESDLWRVEHPAAPSSTAIDTKLRRRVVYFIQLPFVLPGRKTLSYFARFQTSFHGLPMPVWVRVSPSILRVNLRVCLMRLVVPSLAYSTDSRY